MLAPPGFSPATGLEDVTFDPPSLWNIVLTRCEYRVHMPRRKNSLKSSTKKENVYYYPEMPTRKFNVEDSVIIFNCSETPFGTSSSKYCNFVIP